MAINKIANIKMENAKKGFGHNFNLKCPDFDCHDRRAPRKMKYVEAAEDGHNNNNQNMYNIFIFS